MRVVAPRAALAGLAGLAGLAVVLAATAGCGGGGKGGDAKGGGPETPMAVGNLPPLTQAQLEQAVVGPKDLKGWRTGTVQGRGGDGTEIPPTIPDVAKMPRISPAACEPLYDMTMMLSRQQYHGVVEQQLTPADDGSDDSGSSGGAGGGMMSLKSYTGPDAARLMADLRTSLRTCTSFKSLEEGESWGSPKRLADPKAGDEALSYHLVQTVPSVDKNGDDDGGPAVDALFTFVVVRSGSTVLAAYSVPGAGKDYPEFPMDVITAQVTKLAAVH